MGRAEVNALLAWHPSTLSPQALNYLVEQYGVQPHLKGAHIVSVQGKHVRSVSSNCVNTLMA